MRVDSLLPRWLRRTLVALGLLLQPLTASAQFDALPNINVTGWGLVPTETDYVPNVVHCENGNASFEALKAQAVAARTFAYYKMDLQGYINDGTGDQVYSCPSRGTAEPIHEQAALATEGEILWVRDNIGVEHDVLIASFYVAGAIPSGPFDINNPGIIHDAGDPDPTGTEHYVTYPYALDLVGGENQGSTLGWQSGNPANPNWPNRGAKSQNGADYLSDNSVSYLDILKYYYGADIQLRTAKTAGTGAQFGTKTLVDFDDYGDLAGHTFTGHEGTFHRAPTFSGSTTANVAGSTAERSADAAHSGGHSQLLDILYNEASGDDFLLRHVSGARYSDFGGSSNAAARVANLQFESIGAVGFWLKTDDVGLQVSLAIDDPETGDRGTRKNVVADNQWHKYQWFLEEESEWEAWIAAGNGQIDGERVTLDSIQFTGSSDAQIYLDDIFWDPQATWAPSVPGDFDGDGDVDGADLTNWQSGFGMAAGAGILHGDADNDADVDGQDFLIWQSNFTGPGVLSAAATVPEPTSFAMLLTLLACSAMTTPWLRSGRNSIVPSSADEADPASVQSACRALSGRFIHLKPHGAEDNKSTSTPP